VILVLIEISIEISIEIFERGPKGGVLTGV